MKRFPSHPRLATVIVLMLAFVVSPAGGLARAAAEEERAQIGAPEAKAQASAAEVTGEDRPVPRGVVVVVVDALRADGLGIGGNPRPTSPRIDELASGGTVFRQAIAPAPWTLPSVATMLTSLHPSVHGANASSDMRRWLSREFRPTTVLDESRVTLPELLRDAGVRTAAFVNGSYPGKAFGIDQGFELFSDNRRPGVRFNVSDALRWIAKVWPARFFVYLHVIEVHSPYRPQGYPGYSLLSLDAARRAVAAGLEEERERYLSVDWDPGYVGPIDGSWQSLRRAARSWLPPGEADRRQLRARYDRGILYADHWVGELVDGLAALGILGQTAIVVTADHGEELFEHGGVEHGPTYFDEVVRIPLVLRVPGGSPTRVVDEQVGLLDVMPTVLDLLDVPATGVELQGRSLVPATRGQALGERVFFPEAAMVDGLVAARTTTEKLVLQTHTGEAQLYDLVVDPGESHDLCDRRPERCRALVGAVHEHQREQRALLDRLALPGARRAVVDESTRERLRALGYAGDH